jgi:carbon-monoxide dehydrogenase small subunit
MAGNLCRCTGYAGIIRAIKAAAAEAAPAGAATTADAIRIASGTEVGARP